ncbi:retrovirus-related pol polyprotein from transposon TNT 1-94 [Tanacetum coccineum]
MDLYGPMMIQSINGQKYILVIIGDYSQFTRVKFLRSKDKVPEFMIKFLKMIQVYLNATILNIKTDNGTEFVNQTLRAYFEDVGISHQTSVAYTPQPLGVVKRQMQTLVEAARTMLIFSKAPLFPWVEAVATSCFTQNHSLILLGLVPNPPSPASYVPPTKKDWDILFQPMFDEYFSPPPSVAYPVLEVVDLVPTDSTGLPSSPLVDQDAPALSTS